MRSHPVVLIREPDETGRGVIPVARILGLADTLLTDGWHHGSGLGFRSLRGLELREQVS